MAVTYVGAGAQANSSTTTFNVPVPSGVQAGDIIIVSMYVVPAVTITGLPAGFQHVEGSPWPTVDGEFNAHVFWKRATAADAGNYTFTKNVANWTSGQAYAFRGCAETGVPWDEIAYADAGTTGQNFANVDVDTYGPNRLLVLLAINYDGDVDAYSAPDGTWTLVTPGAGAANVGMAYKVQSAAGNTGSVSLRSGAVGSSDNGFASILLALKPVEFVDDAYPDVVETQAGRSSANATSHSITPMPTAEAGDLLVAIISMDGSPTLSTTSTGWNKLGQASQGTDVTGAIFWKIATGSDALTVTSSASERGTWVVYRITEADPDAPFAGSDSATGSSANSDPPNVAPGAGIGDYLWIATRSGDSTVQATAAPANFSALINSDESNTGGAATATAWRKLTASSLDPGPFTSGSEQWVSWTIAIAPARDSAEGTAAFTVDVGMAATGGRMSLGTAPFTANVALAAVGSRPSRGSAAFTVDVSMAGVGRLPAGGTADFGVNVDVAGVGYSPTLNVNRGTAAFKVGISMAGEGHRKSTGEANLGVSVGVAAAGHADAKGSAAFGVEVGLAVEGRGPVLQGQGQAAFTIGVALEAKGAAAAQGSAGFTVNVGMSATGDAPTIPSAQGSVDFKLSLTLASRGAGITRYIPVRVLTRSEILRGNRHTKFYVDLLDTDDAPIGRLDGVEDGNLEWLYNAVVKGGGSLSLTDVGQDINWLTARLRPVMVIDGLDPQPLGVFLVSEAPENYNPRRRWDIKVLDKTTILDQDTIAEAYALDAGAVVTDKIVEVIESAGIYNHSITPSDAVLPSALVWLAGTSKIRIVNDLLSMINYFSLFANFEGQLVGVPYTLPANRPIVYEFIDGSTSIYRSDFVRDSDIWSIPNRLTVVSTGDGTTEGLISTVENNSPTSPYSIPNRGRVIGRTETGVEIVDQTALDNYARRRLTELTSPTAGVKIYHSPVPGLTVNQAVRFRRVPAGIDARHTVTKTSIRLKGTALAQTTFREVVEL